MIRRVRTFLTRHLLPVLLVLLPGCGSVATDSTGGGNAALALAPGIPGDLVLGSTPLIIDKVRIQILRPPSEVVLDTSAVFPASQNSMMLELTLPLKAKVENLTVVLELFDDEALIFSGSREVSVAEGRPLGPIPEIPMTYRGPGANTRSLRILPHDTVLPLNRGIALTTIADDGAGNPTGPVYLRWAIAGPAGTTISLDGVLTGPDRRGSVTVSATAATGAKDSAVIWFAGEPTDLAIHNGNQQSHTVGEPLPLPLIVKLVDDEGIAVPGFRIRWVANNPGAAVSDSVVTTNSEGLASVLATLGPTAGAQTFSAIALGVDALAFDATAEPDLPSSIQIVSGNDQVGAPNQLLSQPLRVLVRDRRGNPIRDALVEWQTLQGGGVVSSVISSSSGDGVSFIQYRLGPQPGDNLVRARLMASGTAVVFTLRAQ